MRRRLFNLLTALSLLLFVAVVVLWFRSTHVGDFGEFVGGLESHTVGGRASVRNVGVYSSHGRLGFGLMRHDYDMTIPAFRHYPDTSRLVWGTEYCCENCPFTPIEGSPASRSWTGIDVRDRSWGGPGWTMSSRGVAVPHALAVAALAVLPALWVLPRWRARHVRRRAGRLLRAKRCPTCGYDLRATPVRCPECGTDTMSAAVHAGS